MRKGYFVPAIVVAVAMVSCGGSGVSDGLRVGIWDTNQEAAVVSVMKDFTDETGIPVNVEVIPWDNYWTLLEAATSGGVLPDVFWMHSNQSIRYASNGILMDLTDRIASSSVTDMSKFPPEIVSLYNYGGRQFGIPKDLDTIALWYNKKLFDEAGVPYPDSTWNWDTLLDAARRLSTGGTFGFSAAISGQSNYWPFVFQNHGWIINNDWTKSGYDDPRTIEALQFLVDMVRDGYSPGPGVFAENNQHALFQSGVLAMAPIGSWVVGEMNRNAYVREIAGITVLPAGRDGTRATIMNGLGWVANAATKKPDDAWKLLEFLSRGDVQGKLSESGIAISAFEGTREGWVRSFPSFDLKPYIEQIPYGVLFPYSKNPIRWHSMTDQFLIQAWTGDRTVEDVGGEIASRMNRMLADE